MKQLVTFTRCNIALSNIAFLLSLLIITAISIEKTTAQGVIGNAIKNKVQQKVIEKAEEGVDEAFDQDSQNQSDSEEEDGDVDDRMKSEESDDIEEEEQDSEVKSSQSKPKLETKSQYDFVPGDKVLFFDDFSQDAIGDFPALWTTTGSGEVKTVNVATGNWLHMTAQDQVYNLMKDLDLPENFIFEFDLIAQPAEEDGHFDFYLTLYNSVDDYLDDGLYPGISGTHVTISDQNWQVRGYHNEKDRMFDGETTIVPVEVNGLSHVIIWVQKARMRIYHKGSKVVDMPTVMYTPTNYNRLRFSLWSSQGTPLVSNVRFTTASPDTRSKLITEGKLISYGIYFDVNSDIIKPESRGTVNDIAKVLNENPDVRIRIDGHTDSDGSDASNLDLSKRRAKSVKNMLTGEFSVAAERIETDGFGESKPIGNNSAVEGKAQNRRVEFIKL
jgi:OmpA-OmpF porin, OOP family